MQDRIFILVATVPFFIWLSILAWANSGWPLFTEVFLAGIATVLIFYFSEPDEDHHQT